MTHLVELKLVQEQTCEPGIIFSYSEEESTTVEERSHPRLKPFKRHASSSAIRHSLDAHPLIRDHFGSQLRKWNPEGWHAAHSRLYEHLRDSTDYLPISLEGLQPLYQAVTHGCQGNRHQEAISEIYQDRILRGNEFFSTNTLGAFGQDLATLSCFFDVPWSKPASGLDRDDAARVLSWAGFRLRALGRLSEAREPMLRSLEMLTATQNWKNSAIAASNLSKLLLLLGQITEAIDYARRAIWLAEWDDAFLKIGVRVTLADALHQAGERVESAQLFADAQRQLRAQAAEFPWLFGAQGYKFCEFLLAQSERVVWQVTPSLRSNGSANAARPRGDLELGAIELLLCCQSVSERVEHTLDWLTKGNRLLDVALAYLTLGCSGLCRAILCRAINESRCRRPDSANSSSNAPHIEIEHTQEEFTSVRMQLDAAVASLRQAGTLHHLPRALLMRAWLRVVQDQLDLARADLNEAQQIVERGHMRLHLADIHLHRARLFHDKEELKRSRALVEQCGYWRRKEELADAEEAAKFW